MIAQLGETGAFEHYGTCRRDDKTGHHPSRFSTDTKCREVRRRPSSLRKRRTAARVP